jgi:hypothetical protein
MKKLILMMALAAGFTIGAHAQTAKKAPTKLPKQLAMKLNLTANQQTKVDAILQTKAAKIDSLTAGDQTDVKKVHKQRKAINTMADVQLDNVLNDDQKKVYADFIAQRQEKAKAKKDAAAPATTPPAQ